MMNEYYNEILSTSSICTYNNACKHKLAKLVTLCQLPLQASQAKIFIKFVTKHGF